MDLASAQLAAVDLLNPDAPTPLDRLFLLLTLLGYWKVLLPAALVLWVRRREAGERLLLALLLTALVLFPLKMALDSERPFTHPNIRSVGTPEEDGSMPSGHAAFAFASTMALGGAYPGKRRALLVLAALIAVSRLYLGQHYPLDLVVGGVIGTAVGHLSAILHSRLQKGLKGGG